MTRLSEQLLTDPEFHPAGTEFAPPYQAEERIIQFGEGNFLRGFVDWMVDIANEKNVFSGRVLVIKPISFGSLDAFAQQGNLYTLALRGVENGQVVQRKRIVSSISRVLDTYADYETYLAAAENPVLRFVVSNTTEAGISYNPDDRPEMAPPASYPGKLTQFLYRRFQAFSGDPSKGLILLPCELIEKNGENLKAIVLRLCEEWKLGGEFKNWLLTANIFCNTLVDRIVTGYPREDIDALSQEAGYEDSLYDTGEVFHLWVIEGPKTVAEEFPLDRCGLHVVFTDNLKPYRDRKVRILNGAHTMTVLAAYLGGLNTVLECMEDSLVHAYMKKGLFEEIIPTLTLPKEELDSFSAAVTERFSNPFIKHYLLSISLNSVSKFKARVLPSLLEYVRIRQELPKVLSFSLAALICFYKGEKIEGGSLIGSRNGEAYKVTDDLAVLEFFRDARADFGGCIHCFRELVRKTLANESFWGTNLSAIPGLAELVAGYAYEIEHSGAMKAMAGLLGE